MGNSNERKRWEISERERLLSRRGQSINPVIGMKVLFFRNICYSPKNYYYFLSKCIQQ